MSMLPCRRRLGAAGTLGKLQLARPLRQEEGTKIESHARLAGPMTGAEHEAVAVQAELKARLQRLEKSHQETFGDLGN